MCRALIFGRCKVVGSFLFFSLFCVGLDRAWLARDAILTERLVSVRKKAEVKCKTTLISQTCLFNSNRKFCGGHD